MNTKMMEKQTIKGTGRTTVQRRQQTRTWRRENFNAFFDYVWTMSAYRSWRNLI
jgi:hypothetical protein